MGRSSVPIRTILDIGDQYPCLAAQRAARVMAMDATKVTAAIKTLEKTGRVRLVPDADDDRARHPVLTDLR